MSYATINPYTGQTEQEFEPRLKSRMTDAGIVTPPLDDMYPHLPAEVLDRVRREAIERTS